MNFLDSSQAMDYALNRDRMRLKELSPIASFLLLVVVPIFALAAPREKAMVPSVCPLAMAAETKAEMARYSLKAYGNCDATNVVKGLLFTPKPVGMNALPMVVYIPGNGEIGDVARQFRQRAIFDRITSGGYRVRHGYHSKLPHYREFMIYDSCLRRSFPPASGLSARRNR